MNSIDLDDTSIQSLRESAKNGNIEDIRCLVDRLLDECTKSMDKDFLVELYQWIAAAYALSDEKKFYDVLQIIDLDMILYPDHRTAYSLADAYLSSISQNVEQLFNTDSWQYRLWDWEKALGLKLFPRLKSKLYSVERLHLDDHTMSCLPDEIQYLTKLETLSIENNEFTQLPEWLGDLPIRSLVCSFNFISEFPESLICMTSLTELKASYNRFEVFPSCITEVKSLKELSLFGNPFCSTPAEIGQLCNLEILDLRETLIEKLPEEIAALTQLKRLFLSSKYLSEEEQSNIQKMLPNCKIIYDAPWMVNIDMNAMADLYFLEEGTEKVLDHIHDDRSKIDAFQQKLTCYPRF